MNKIKWHPTEPHDTFSLYGFSAYEHWGCWSDGKLAEIKIEPKEIEENKLAIAYIIFSPFIPKGKENLIINIETSWGYRESIKLESSAKEFLIDLPIRKASEYIISLNIENPCSPKELGISTDGRLLGVGIKQIILAKDESVNVFDFKTFNLYEIGQELFSRENKNKGLDNLKRQILGSKDIISDALSSAILGEAEYIDPEKSKALFSAACHLKSFPTETTKKLTETLGRIIRQEEQAPPKQITDKEKKIRAEKIIVIGGFFYSGSSAIYDYLRDFAECTALTPYDFELPLVAQTYRLNLEANRHDLKKHFIENLIGISLPSNSEDSINLKRKEFSIIEAVRLNQSNITIEEYANSVSEYINNYIGCSDQGKKKAFTDFILSCAGIHPKENIQHLLLNQSPTATYIEALNAFEPGARFIAVTRDPRDQYIDQINHNAINQGIYKDVDGFIRKFIKDRERFKEKKKILKDYSISEVFFEDFVTNRNTREELRASIGIRENKRYTNFDPKKSEKNIRKYLFTTDSKTKRDLAKIEAELSEYLWSS